MYNGNTFNDAIDKWMNILFYIPTKCIPYYEINVRPGDKDFMNSEIRSLMSVQDGLWNQHKVSGDQAIYIEFKIVRNQIVSKIGYSKDLQSTKRNQILCNPKVASKKW